MTDLPEWYVIFDEQDTHPVTGQHLGGQYTILNGTRETARKEACRRFGNNWATLIPRTGDEVDGSEAFPYTHIDPDHLLGLSVGATRELAETWAQVYAGYDGRR